MLVRLGPLGTRRVGDQDRRVCTCFTHGSANAVPPIIASGERLMTEGEQVLRTILELANRHDA